MTAVVRVSTFVSLSAGKTGMKSYWWLRLLRVVAIVVFVVGLLAQPVAMILVNMYCPSAIYDSLGGPVDPISDSWFWATLAGPSAGVLLFTAYNVWKAFLSAPDITWQELFVRWLLGVAAAFALLPVMFMVTLLLPSFLR